MVRVKCCASAKQMPPTRGHDLKPDFEILLLAYS